MLAAASALLFAQVVAPPTITPVRTDKAPTLDGDLSDAVWAKAATTSSFTQKFPNEGSAPSERTTLKILYDDEALYIGFDVEQREVPVMARMARRDRDIEADNVSIVLDSRSSGKTGFEFIVNAAGVLQDGIRANDIQQTANGSNYYNPAWDENWDARTKRTDHGWSAELKIPFRILRFSSGDLQSWGFQARRYTSMRQETDEWSLVPRNVMSEVARYGRLTDMRIHPRADLELKPFVLGRLVRRDRNDVSTDHGLSPGASAGLDLRWHLTPDLTLDATINPDFTQVEGDELFLNLSNFESYYPEKRPFFVEGSEIFEIPAPIFFARPFTLLYTRRIGLRPDVPTLRPNPPYSDELVDTPEASTILGATKLVGRLGAGWSVGAMSAITAANTVDVQEPGLRRKLLVEPATGYQVLRLKHDFSDGRAQVGFLGTAVTRAENTTEYPTYVPAGTTQTHQICPDDTEIAVGQRCTHDAYVGSIDGLWRSSNNEILLSAETLASVIEQGSPRTFRDGTIVGNGDAGYGAQVVFAREGGSGLAWNTQYQLASSKLDFNDLGFMERQNQHFYYANLEYRTFEPIGPTIETHSWVEVAGRYNLDGTLVGRRWLTDIQARYKNFWTSYLELNFDQKHYDDREIGNGLPFERPARPGFDAALNTDKRNRFYVQANVFGQKIPRGGDIEARMSTVFRAHPQLEIEIDPSATYTSGETRFATLGETPSDMIFGNLHAASFATTARVNFTITPRLSLQAFGQLFLASGHFDEFRGITATSGTVRLDDLVPVAAPAVNPDFIDVSLNVNVVLRWEYSLGSIVYFVYNRSQTPATTLVLDEPASLSFTQLSRAPATDTLLLKWQLYFNL